MKTFCYGLLIVTSAFSAGAQGAFSGVISFGNVGVSLDRRIWVNDTGVVGQGQLATGTGYKIALYWGQLGTPEAGLVQVGSAVAFAPLGAGQFSGGHRTVTGLAAPGGVVTVQARAWTTIPGVPDTYEAVLAAGLAGDTRAIVAGGPVFDHDTFRIGDPTDPAIAIGNDPNWRGFALTTVPEPSAIALSLLGVGTLLMLRHRSAINKLKSNIRR